MNLEKNSIARRYVYGKQTANKNKKVVLSVFSGFDKNPWRTVKKINK